jgi:hypothetical protein
MLLKMKTLIYLLFLTIFYFNLFAHHPGHKIEAETPYPTIKIKLIKDNMDGYNLLIDLNNFTLAPEQVGKKNKPNTGHLHLYVNDIKIARIYSKWFHIPGRYFNLKENLIKVTLNANMHGEFTIDGNPIQANIIELKN